VHALAPWGGRRAYVSFAESGRGVFRANHEIPV
jgi:hypothetical protein